ncbi:MAG: MATE family efflux transporter [Leptolyngbya sp. SIOISBB]|nr:MATE family efflux transporter [Leptolyngbya sp. SIOISBB]
MPFEIRTLLRLAIPLTFVQVAEGMVNVVDTLMMGQLGTVALAGGGLGAVIFWTFLSLFSGLLEMTGALAAEAYGAGQDSHVGVITSQALLLSLVVAIPTMIVCWHLDTGLLALGQSPQIVAATMAYLRAILWGLPAALGLFVLKEITTALMQPRLLTVLMVGSIPVNIVLNHGLMYGKWGLPQLGLAGIGWSSVLIFWGMFGAIALRLRLRSDLQKWALFRSIGHLYPSVLRQIVHLGWPLCVDYGTEFGALTVAALMMGWWGADWLAAHRIVMTTTEVLLMFSWGLSYATAMCTAHQLGADRPDTAQRLMGMSLLLNGVVVGILAMPLWLLPETITGFYVNTRLVDNQAILQSAISLFKVGIVFQIFQGFRLISLGTLQGLHDTHWLAIVDFGAHWVIGIGGGYLLGQTWQGQGLGLWWGLALGQLVAALLLGYRVQFLLHRRLQARTDIL